MTELDSARTAEDERHSSSRLISASMVMAAGTMLSRVLGFGRLMLLVVLFGNGTRQVDMFTYANTVPNSMYILLAGGVLNTVLVPQIVRAIKLDPDGGEAYINRIMTAGLGVLAAITVTLTVAAPWIVWLYTPDAWRAPGRAAQYDSIIMLAYYCLPQIFFYGVHVLAGQLLNARDRFGPMMWAPIANNIISIAVLLVFWFVYGQGDGVSAFTAGEELLLGLGSTLGIAAQAIVLVPFLRSAGYHFRPRWDFKNTGLGKTARLAKWTIGFVLVNQLALIVVNRLAGRATADGEGAGLAVYYNAYAVWILPHSLITVSLATAMLPAASRYAAAGDLNGVSAETMRALRLAVTALLPASVALLALGSPVARLAFGFGKGAEDAEFVGWALMALAVGLVPFTVQYICLRAFYALEDNRTTFFLQILIASTNVLLGIAVVLLLDNSSLVATGLAVAYSGAYLLGVVVSFRTLRRRLTALSGAELVRHGVRLLLAVAPAAAVAATICWAFGSWSDTLVSRLLGLAVAGVMAVGIFLGLSHALQIREVDQILHTVLRRGARRADEPDAATGPRPDPDEPSTPGDSSTGIESESPTIENAVVEPGTPAGGVPHENTEPDVSQPGATQTPVPRAGTPDVDEPEEPAAASRLSAGIVLAQRYRLEELLSQTEPTLTWRAFDQVLSRSVLIHLLPSDDPRAPGLLEAARRAAAATDSRFLRVLDAVHSENPEIGSYIVCEYAVGQSLEVILSHGPLSGLEAAWVIREVADALSGVHAVGLFHQRISPDTVIITPTGNIKIVGLLIEEALRPARSEPVSTKATPEQVDVLDLGRLLYASLVSRWPGGPAFSLPAAPVSGQRWLTPRQVRAGVSPALDQVCDQILGDPPRHRAPQIVTANDVVNALTKVLGPGDASSDLERRLRQPVPTVSAHSQPVSPLLDQPTQLMPAADLPGPPTSGFPESQRLPPPHHSGSHQAFQDAASAARPTGVGRVTTAWSSRPDPDTRPDADTRTVIRNPAPPQPPPAEQRRPGRRWLGLLVALLALVLAAVTVWGVLTLDRRNARSGAADPAASATASSSSGVPTQPVRITAARDFDPQGDDRTENSDEVKLAIDGDPETRWRTVKYLGNAKLGGIKRGVGLVLDLGTVQSVRSVTVALSGSGTTVQARVPDGKSEISSPPMTSDRRWRTVSEQKSADETASLTFDQPVSTRYVLVYLTSLPKDGNGYRGGIYEVQVFQ
ncbi:MAG TPA: murein biosynthesis integral membrane protein MurJ [Propionibacteriaceae bacterium]|nr:murein biosynthesis integral membrane protein MurJ [Propionibacteriaceae bacterium]